MSNSIPDDFIRRYLLYTAAHESPRCYHQWIAIGIIGASLGRRVVLDMGHYRVFPNNFIILTSGSAECRKGGAMDMGIDILREHTETHLFEGKITLEKMYQEMSKKIAPQQGVVAETPSIPLVIYADELAVFLHRNAQQAGLPSVLCTLYTNPPKHDYRTKTAGSSYLIKPSINILSTTQPAWMQRNLSQETFEEGLVGRLLPIYADKPRSRVTMHNITAKEKGLQKLLAAQLNGISKIEGNFRLTGNALKVYDEWYQTRKAPKDGEVEKICGFWGREHAHVLKTAMIFALSTGNQLQISDGNLSAAIEAVREVRETLPYALKGGGAEQDVQHISLVLNELKNHGGPMSYEQLGQKLWRHMGSTKMEEAIDSLIKYGKIVPHRPEGSQRLYFIVV